MPVFLVVYDPTKGNEHEMTAALHRWKGARIFRGAWLVEFDSRAELALRALAKAARANISCAIVEISPNGDHAEMGAGAAAREALRRFAPMSSGL